MTDLLSSVIAAHGGLDRWRTVRAIDATFNFSGGLLDLKGYPGHRRPSASVDAATPRTVFQRLGDESDPISDGSAAPITRSEGGLLMRVLPEWRAGIAKKLSVLMPTRRGLLPSVRAFIDFLSSQLPPVVTFC
jgi:hypothetical protein